MPAPAACTCPSETSSDLNRRKEGCGKPSRSGGGANVHSAYLVAPSCIDLAGNGGHRPFVSCRADRVLNLRIGTTIRICKSDHCGTSHSAQTVPRLVERITEVIDVQINQAAVINRVTTNLPAPLMELSYSLLTHQRHTRQRSCLITPSNLPTQRTHNGKDGGWYVAAFQNRHCVADHGLEPVVEADGNTAPTTSKQIGYAKQWYPKSDEP